MKLRIIDDLKKIALYNENNPPDILKELVCKERYIEIKNKAIKVLNYIFANYSDFSIMTIDSFIQKMMKSFSIELEIPMNFELFIDEKEIIDISCREILAQYGNEEDEITKSLILMVKNRIASNSSWDIRNEVINNANSIYNMQLNNPIDWIKFEEKYLKWIKEYKKLRNQIIANTNKFFDLTNFYNIKKEVLNNNIWKYFERLKIIDQVKIGDLKFKKTMTNFFENYETGINKDFKNDNIINENIGKIMSEIFYIKDNLTEYLKYRIVVNNIYNLIIFQSIHKKISKYKNQNNILFLSDSLQKIKELFENSENEGHIVPFLYYKLGNKYENFLIDEFQDTSKTQWQALEPLIQNSISENNKIVIVGDLKQAIYRWRGGDIEIMENEISNYPENILNLKKNYRSDYYIIDFNNKFFNKISEDKTINWQYNDISQEITKNTDKGYVELNIPDKDTDEEYIGLRTIEIIRDAINRKYSYKDICILIRNNKDSDDLIRILNKNGIPFITPENLNLSSSPFVLFVINILKFFLEPDNKSILSLILLSDIINANINQLKDLENSEQKTNKFFEIIEKIKGKDIADNLKSLFGQRYQKGIYGIIAEIINIFGKNDSFAAILLNRALDYSDKGGIIGFINDWETKIKNQKIDIPENINAVKIMTIFKAKGLQFPIVIIPKANWEIDFKSNISEILKVKFDNCETYIKIKSDLKGFFNEYEIEKRKRVKDNINLLYVAFTRSENELYIIVESKYNEKHISSIIKNTIIKMENTVNKVNNENAEIYYFGKKMKKEEDNEEIENKLEINEYTFYNWQERKIAKGKQMIVDNRSIVMGKAFHKYMEKSRDFTLNRDLLNNIEMQYELNNTEITDIEKWVKNVINTDIIKHLSDSNFILKKEVSIINNKANILNEHRIDLLAIKDNNAIIVDYKTGEFEEEHIKQIKTYVKLIKEMNYITKGYIIYTDGEIKEIQ